MKPAFSYYGGKQRIAGKIIPYIHKHTVYAEPFCGGATILFRKPRPKVTNTTHYREYINDLNGLVFNFFDVLSRRGNELAERIAVYPMCEQHHRESLKICKNPEGVEELDLAIAFFVNIQQSFSNQLNTGWKRAVYSRNTGATWAKNSILFDYVERMKSVGVSNTDALKFIKQFDSPQTFFYCDPPYPGANQGHYGGYTREDFYALIDIIDKSQSNAIISCYPMDGCLDNVQSKWEIVEIEASMSSSKVDNIERSKEAVKRTGHKRTEVLYIKRSSVKPRSEILELYESGKYDCFTGKTENLI